MKRITFHLSGVKPKATEIKKFDPKTEKPVYTTKNILYNTISHECATEEDGLAYMAQYLDLNKRNTNLKVTSYHFSNLK